jgi:hypothetical protein
MRPSAWRRACTRGMLPPADMARSALFCAFGSFVARLLPARLCTVGKSCCVCPHVARWLMAETHTRLPRAAEAVN